MEVNIPETVQWRASAEARYHTTERTIEFLCHKSAASEVDDTKTRDSGADVNQDVRLYDAFMVHFDSCFHQLSQEVLKHRETDELVSEGM